MTADPALLRALRARVDFERTVEVLRAEGVLGSGDDPLAGLRMFRGQGCAQCNGSGFRGRVGVFELLVVNDAVRSAIAARRRHRKELERGAGIIALDGKVSPALGQDAGSPSSVGTAQRACRLKPCLCRKHRLIGV